MDFRLLNYFLVIAEEGNVTKASQKLHISQPALSKQLQSLERELGTSLFIRENKRMTLTDDGALFRAKVSQLVEMANALQAEFSSPMDQLAETIYIGAGRLNALQLFGRIADEINSEYPAIKFNFYSSSTKGLTSRLNDGLLDFAVLGQVDTERHNYINLNLPAYWGLLMRKDCALASRESITSEDLMNTRLLCPTQPLLIQEISEWLPYNFKKLNVVATFNLLWNALILINEGFGCALCLSADSASFFDESFIFLPLEPKISSETYLAWRKSAPISRSARIFIQRVKQYISVE